MLNNGIKFDCAEPLERRSSAKQQQHEKAASVAAVAAKQRKQQGSDIQAAYEGKMLTTVSQMRMNGGEWESGKACQTCFLY